MNQESPTKVLPKHFSKTMESNFYVPQSQENDGTTQLHNTTLSSRQSSDHRAFISLNQKSDQYSSIKDCSHTSLQPENKETEEQVKLVKLVTADGSDSHLNI